MAYKHSTSISLHSVFFDSKLNWTKDNISAEFVNFVELKVSAGTICESPQYWNFGIILIT